MRKRLAIALVLFVSLSVFVGSSSVAQESGPPRINVTVDLVQLNVAVTDSKGKYVTGLRPEDFIIAEDGIPEDIATYGEGNESARALLSATSPGPTSSGPKSPDAPRSEPEDSGAHVSASELTALVGGANVFVL